MIETERRFLLKELPPNLDKSPSKIIEDRMILTGEPHPHLRLRKNGGKFVLTKKYPKEGDSKLEMVEETIDLNEAEFNALKKLENTGQIKRRYNYKYNGLDAEVDIWLEDLDGLAVVEFEFESTEAAREFAMPDFCLVEITNKEWLAGGKLSGRTFEEVRRGLEGLGYHPLN